MLYILWPYLRARRMCIILSAGCVGAVCQKCFGKKRFLEIRLDK